MYGSDHTNPHVFILQAISELLVLNVFTLVCLQMKIRLKYRFSFVRNGQEVVEMGDVSNFPY